MVGSAGVTPRPVPLPVHARGRFWIALDTISAPAPRLSDCHRAIMDKIMTNLDYVLPDAGFTAGRMALNLEEGHGIAYSLYCPLIRIPRNSTPAQNTDVIFNRLTAIICEHAKGLTIDGSIAPTFNREILPYEQAMTLNPNFDGVQISLRFEQLALRPVTL